MSGFAEGIAPDHWPALLAALLLVPGAWWLRGRVERSAAAGAGWAVTLRRRWAALPDPARWAVWLLATTAVVHAALPLGHAGSPLLSLLFVASAAAYAALAWRVVAGRPWRAATALLMVATLVAYLVVVARGEEEADQLGLATALVELVTLGLCLVPALGPRWTVRRLLVRPLAATAFVLATLLTGTVVWVVFAVQHDDHNVGAEPAGHEHEAYAARAQSGIILRPGSAEPPTEAQQRAAAALAVATRAATVRYRDYHAALADGYRPSTPLAGLQVHFEKKANQADGRVVDPLAPEMLVYAADAGRIALLGVVYQMPRAGEPGPAVGGSSTRWHAHNICVTLLPPGFGPVSPYGSCPFASFAVTIAEMIHVWTVEPPGGPYAEHLDDAWVRALVARDGVPLSG
jgi:hypothetical protein